MCIFVIYTVAAVAENHDHVLEYEIATQLAEGTPRIRREQQG